MEQAQAAVTSFIITYTQSYGSSNDWRCWGLRIDFTFGGFSYVDLKALPFPLK
jgi:hypothetical protein